MSFKINNSPSFFKNHTTLQKKLFGYMFILVTILLCIIVVFSFLLGRFKDTSKDTFKTLSLQAKVFDRDISSYYDGIIAKCTYLSELTAVSTEKYLKENNITFSSLDNSVYHIENIEAQFMDLISSSLLRSNCSGAFIMLNRSRTASNENSKAGVYIQKDILGSNKTDALLLYRGTASIGKEKGIMPHRKWKLEFKKDGFPNYDSLSDLDNIQNKCSCHITDVIVLPDMSERVMLVVAPIKGSNNEFLGICGFEISESFFKAIHAQPTTFSRLTCVFSRKTDNAINCDEGLLCGVENGYFLPAKGLLKAKNIENGLKEFKNEYGAYVGISADLPLCVENNNYEITVMIPKNDYMKNRVAEFLQIALIILLFGFAAIFLCRHFSKRYISPVIVGLNKLKQSENDVERSNIAEIDDIFDYLAEKSKKYKQSIEVLKQKNETAQNTIKKIKYDRKNEISPDDYQYFAQGLKTLTPAEQNIFNMYLEGKNIRQIAEENNIKESTVKFHNHNIYDKLGVTNKKELLKFATIYLEKKE